MKNIILTLFLILFCVSAVLAQNADVTVKQVNNSNSSNTSVITGRGEVKDLISNHPKYSGLPSMLNKYNQIARINIDGHNNQGDIVQEGGTGNIGVIDIQGDGNDLSINQKGTQLWSILNVVKGNNNIIDVVQKGTNLKNYVEVSGEGVHMQLNQDNSDYKFTQQGGNAIPLIISSNSRNVPIIIHNK